MLHKEEHESQIKCPADKFFGWFKHELLDLPNAMPGSYKSVQVLEGDGKTKGTVRLWTYAIPNEPDKVLTAKDMVEEMDDENMSFTSRILEGELMEDYESFAIKLSVTPTSDGGSLVKWVFEFEKKHDRTTVHIHTPIYVDLFALLNNHFDDLLHKADD